MARINLLPWRDELRKQKKKEFAAAAGFAAFVMLLVVAYGHIHITGMIDAQNGRNNLLAQEIKNVEAKIKEIEELESQKEQLLSRMKVIEQLQSDRPEIVRRFDLLVRLIPDGLYIKTLDQKGDLVTIEGVAQSNARVSAFMRALDESDLYKTPKLIFIKNASDKTGTGEGRDFKMQVTHSKK